MKRKKIAFIIPSLKAGGAERVVSSLANQLINEFDIVIVVLYKCTPFYSIDSKVKIAYAKNLYNSTPSFFQSLRNHYDLIKKSKTIIKDFNADVIIGFTTSANIYSVIIAKQLKIPSIISERIHPKYGSISNFWVKVRKYVYPKTNALVIQTNDIRNYFKSFVHNNKISIINNPLSDELANQKLENVSKKNHIICVGRLEHQKNQELLINAFSNIERGNWQLLLIGEGHKREQFQNLINQLNLNDSVKLLGNSKDISKYYNSAKIFVLPSNYEGFPNALIEAMYFGMACISTNCPSGPSEIINDGENGFLIPVNDQLQLEKKLTILLENEVLQNQFRKKAMESTACFKADFIANKWKELIYKVLQ
ncbi:glycosyltransferase family 4 protein [Lacinutrix iliipiscaria]|uniref:Glycosyltransferase family 4 protein n=1 Tax=Lacinutrix iliipiscaria TaxID=1230532 RepID=A0ABW5WQY8_9FLAO